VESAHERLRAGDAPAAAAQLREAIGLAPAFEEAHYLLARAMRELAAERSDTEEVLRRVLQLNPRHALAYYDLGRLQAGTDPAAAAAAFRRATELAPGMVVAHRALAELAEAREDWPTVISSLEAVAAWEPGDGRVHVKLGQALSRRRAWAEALVTLRIATMLEPEFADAHYALAEALAASGATDEAARALATARHLASLAGRRGSDR
jgi:protein O-GlcNAc transferase